MTQIALMMMTLAHVVYFHCCFIVILNCNACPIEFKISAAIRQQSHNGNSPLNITSSVTFEELQMLIGKKLDHFSRLLKLCYRLNIDKAKDNVTTIHNEEEMKIFKDWMRPLIVPQRLSNGKISTQILKQVIIFFEDSSGSVSTGGSAGSRRLKSTNSKGSRKKVIIDDGTLNALEENQTQKTIKTMIADLQKCWKCTTHSKDKEKCC